EYLDKLKICRDAKFCVSTEIKGNYKIVGNIPYYLTSFLLRKIFEMKDKPSEMILMVQKEVAERIVASPRQGRSKKGEMNLLAISVQMFTDPEILFYVSKNSFWPKPKVDSAVIRLKIKKAKKQENKNTEYFFKVVHAGFAAKRKLVVNNLAKGLDIPKEKIYDIFREMRISENARAQDLSIEDWLGIYNQIKN
ncbi:MAG: rRNA adenine dimethyltransferase family protein, partial [Patescibacteria group bacterium]|nr:rRNA adenine dimethyltransferase family protein [Patescibacteria group bacterium]